MNVDQRDSLIHFLSRLFGSKEINEYLCAVKGRNQKPVPMILVTDQRTVP